MKDKTSRVWVDNVIRGEKPYRTMRGKDGTLVIEGGMTESGAGVTLTHVEY